MKIKDIQSFFNLKNEVIKAFRNIGLEVSTSRNYSFNEVLPAIKLLNVNHLQKELFNEQFSNDITDNTAVLKDEYLIDGMKKFLDTPEHNKRRCCENCAFLIGSTAIGSRIYPYCSFFDTHLMYPKKKVNIFWDYCRSFRRSSFLERLWYNNKAPTNLNSRGEIETTTLGIDRKQFTDDNSEKLFRTLF